MAIALPTARFSPPFFPLSTRPWFSARSVRSPVAVLSVLLSFLLHLHHPSSLLASSFPHHKPAYDSHVYYVIETHPAQSYHAIAKELASGLFTDLVERVGELEEFWLVRAPKDFVDQGYAGFDRQSLPGTLQTRSLAALQSSRDTVLERFELIRRAAHDPRLVGHLRSADLHHLRKRSLPLSKLSPRDLASSIKWIDRQVLRKRHKRDAIYVPAPDGSAPVLQHGQDPPLVKRNDPVSNGLSAAAAKKYHITDPLWPKQWHLVNDILPHHMVNATGVWDLGITGKGVAVAIVDDGLDMTSDDLKSNFFEKGSWDYNDHTPLPEPRLPDDLHGTRCAGEIAAIKNDVCGVGVAFDAKVAGIRILSASISDADEASALNYGFQHNHIYSCSWGPPDDGKSMEAPSRLIFKAILNGIQKGRNGKGSVFVFASGNGGAVDDQCNFDGYTNSIYSITISAIDRKGFHPYYSEVCSANMAVTYSSGSGDNIHTTDVGKNKCTDRHGGTSAAAPLGAGILALVLAARPDLAWRDVQHLVVNTAIPFSTDDPEWQRTAAGKWYNHRFGFGNMDAYRIVEAAKTWKLVKPQAWWKSPNVNANSLPVTREGANATIMVKQSDLDGANFEKLEHITVAVNIKHLRRGNVRVTLTSPHGTASVLATHRRFDEADTGFPGWVFMSVKHWGENPVGIWTLSVQDRFQQENKGGTFEDWAMGMWGECINPEIQEQFRMPDDAEILLPPDPTPGVALESVMPLLSASLAAATSSPTQLPHPPLAVASGSGSGYKSIARPTEHLPDDHSGNATENLTTGFGGMSTHLKGKSSWVFAALGTVIVVIGSFGGWFVLSRLRNQNRIQKEEDEDVDTGVGLLSGSTKLNLFGKVIQRTSQRPQNTYGFEPVAAEDDLPMRSMMGELNPGRFKKKTHQTKDLYDAFGGGSESEEDDESARAHDQAAPQRHSMNDLRKDEEYMDSFLEDDANSASGSFKDNQHQLA